MGGLSPYLFLFWQLARAEFKGRDQGSVLGFLWTLLQPALMFTVLYAIFIRWLGMFVANYAGYLLVGLVLWNFFARATTTGLSCFRRRSQLLRNYNFPREVMVFSCVAAVLAFSLLELLILLPLLAWLGAPPTLTWLWLPAIMALFCALTTGFSLILAVAAARFHDVERIWEVSCTALFYLTPVFYPAHLLAGWKGAALSGHPISLALSLSRGCLLEGRAPAPGAFLALAGCATVALAAGLALTRAFERDLTEFVLT
jgi:lipopolysaccharide transport system permease protein